MKAESISKKTMAMKARAFNASRTLLYPYTTKPFEVRVKGKTLLTPELKLALFDQMYEQFILSRDELRQYKKKRKFKAEVERKRLEKQLSSMPLTEAHLEGVLG